MEDRMHATPIATPFLVRTGDPFISLSDRT